MQVLKWRLLFKIQFNLKEKINKKKKTKTGEQDWKKKKRGKTIHLFLLSTFSGPRDDVHYPAILTPRQL